MPCQATLVINKVDLCHYDAEREEYLEAVSYLYRSIGYRVMHTSTLTGEGVDALREAMAGKTSLFSGNSGVGKSSLINCLIPGMELRTAEISTTHDTGMHTTTFSEMFALPGGGAIIDTRGSKVSELLISTLPRWGIISRDVQGFVGVQIWRLYPYP